jgi:hypothetical protein
MGMHYIRCSRSTPRSPGNSSFLVIITKMVKNKEKFPKIMPKIDVFEDQSWNLPTKNDIMMLFNFDLLYVF